MHAVTRTSASAGGEHIDVESLIKTYCPPLEAGLVHALASDFDPSDTEGLKELCSTLDELKGSAAFEQDLELLPPAEATNSFEKVSGNANNHNLAKIENLSSQPSQNSVLDSTEEDGVTSVTTGISGLKYSDLDDSDFDHGSGYGEAGINFDSLTDHDKQRLLCKMFPNVKAQNIEDVLARCAGNFDRSTDELLNLSFLEQNHGDHGDQHYVVPKGVDAFLQDVDDGSRRKTKGKGRRKKNHAEHNDSTEAWHSDSVTSSGLANANVWKKLPEDIEFIVSRTHLRPRTVTSIYHANSAHLAPTIRALAMKEGDQYTKASYKVDEIMELQMDELRVDYSHVSDAQIYGVLMLANNIPSAAIELLDAMLKSNEKPVLLGKVTGLASYTPVDLSEDDSRPKKALGGIRQSTIPVSGGVYTTSHLANSHGVSATSAFQQASAAYRRGKSDHLMGGAAAYYASVGHDRIKAAKSLQASAADAHVASQSSSTSLDLHGVNVSDAVRIAQRGVEGWWEGLGDRKYVVGGMGYGYRIITGAGKHSADGIGRIGPAVSKMLVREGWRVEVGRGEVTVSGRARK